jgi:hypothetical protein
LHFSDANSSLPLNEFLEKFEEEAVGRVQAATHEKLRRERVLAEAGEILGKSANDVVALVTGVSVKASVSETKK